MARPTTSLDVEIYQSGTDLYFLIRGRIILEECEGLRNLCIPLIHKNVEQVIVDLSKVDFIDSAGLGVLVGFKMTSSKNKARIILLQPSKPVADILYISKLDGIFDIITGPEADTLKGQIAVPENRTSRTPQQQAAEESPAQPQKWVESRLDTAFTESPAATDSGGTGSGERPTKDEKEQIEEHCRKAVEFMRQGNYEMSVEEYRAALEIFPDYLPALNNLAIVYEKQPSWIPKAIEQWEKVLKLSSDRGDNKHQDRASRHLANLKRMSVS